jgi:hypothetical protein
MIDIGSVAKNLHPGEHKERIDQIQTRGSRLATRIEGTFTLVGHRAVQLVGSNDVHYHALIHNEPDDPTDYMVVHSAGDNVHLFEASKKGDTWIITYIENSHYDVLMEATAGILLEHANEAYSGFLLKNMGTEPESLMEKDINLDSFAEDLSKMDITFSHAGNKRLAY